MSRWEHRYLVRTGFPRRCRRSRSSISSLSTRASWLRFENAGDLSRLALALQVGFLKMTGRTLNPLSPFPRGSSIISAGTSIACRRGSPRSGRSIAGASTLFEHRGSAPAARTYRAHPHAGRGLRHYLRREAAVVFDHDDLAGTLRIWLVEHHYLLLRERDIRRQVIVARRHHEQALFKTIAAAVPAAEVRPGCRGCWRPSRARSATSNGWVPCRRARAPKASRSRSRKSVSSRNWPRTWLVLLICRLQGWSISPNG